MSKKNKDFPILENVTITDFAAEGKCVTRINDLVIFVPFVVPGDIADLKILKKKHSYAEATAVRLVKPSPDRIEPFCQHFGICGGCKWQNMPYSKQLEYKTKQVKDNLERIAKVNLPEISPIIGSEQTSCYRNKLEYSCSNMRWLTSEELSNIDVTDDRQRKQPGIGFHIPGAFDKVLHIEKCWLQNDISNQIRNHIYKYSIDNNLPFINLRSQEGMLRDVMIRIATTGQIMVLVQAKIDHDSQKEQFMELMQSIADTFDQITSLLYVINNKCNDTISDLDIITFKGQDCIYEQMEDLQFKIGPKSFFQTNTNQACTLYSKVREFAAVGKNDLVYDLYTGTGTIAQFVARSCRQVIGIEYVPEAIADAKLNAEFNHIDNTQFFAGDMKDMLTQDFIDKYGKPDVIITDPPRVGMHKDVVDMILWVEAPRIVYVSCNPATLARDLALLDAKYNVDRVQPVDMFPHTQHIEVVTLLSLKKN
ncbi:MAG: 23S rRNA (uracil(1939)-C(5))-methyltransferase RlmD [Bacteroidaceae bacterium]|nr:23S rRNA (uracil(1939)-C(5))-methyltransferase RlmD [Bacteroidaceae bacterium]